MWDWNKPKEWGGWTNPNSGQEGFLAKENSHVVDFAATLSKILLEAKSHQSAIVLMAGILDKFTSEEGKTGILDDSFLRLLDSYNLSGKKDPVIRAWLTYFSGNSYIGKNVKTNTYIAIKKRFARKVLESFWITDPKISWRSDLLIAEINSRFIIPNFPPNEKTFDRYTIDKWSIEVEKWLKRIDI